MVCDDEALEDDGVVVCDDSPEDDSGDVDDSVRLGPRAQIISESSSLAPPARKMHGKSKCEKGEGAGKFKVAVVRVVVSRVLQTFLPMSGQRCAGCPG